ncbi:low molecular weight protein-tyrosine-phosphatase [Roseateles amylovorans]|uniref:protein-tyrosine-phosphatase n=1 Tax=Roseateles amylovorans TaxID=2978473 RepID=A0ABY6AU70_9BURK|nr:low molecular weight protein-tyrosine-phosphatase [Roseateles amylovorans]UXH76330.1 low molecular weight phosphotyrosine protein phosphatase [Roseateles amylovorans]
MSSVDLSVLFVCTGNICRSPTAEGVLRSKLSSLGWADRVHIDSAGVQGWHAGEPPDPRSQDHARKRGYELSGQRARALRPNDFERFDLIVAMDAGHLRELRRRCPAPLQHRLGLLPGEVEIPDPYYGGPDGFEDVLDRIEQGCERLAQQIVARIGP